MVAEITSCNQLGFQLVIFALGLPKIAKIVGGIKSYAEKLFNFIEVDKLEENDAQLALTRPAERLGVKYTEEVLEEIICHTKGVHFFFRIWVESIEICRQRKKLPWQM